VIDHGPPQGLSWPSYQAVSSLLDPDEQIDIVIVGVLGDLVATDRRIVVRKARSIRSFSFDELAGVEVLVSLMRRYVILRGPGLPLTVGAFEIGRPTATHAVVIKAWDIGSAREKAAELTARIRACQSARRSGDAPSPSDEPGDPRQS